MTRRTVPITLPDGKPRSLRYGFNALAEIVDTLGIPLSDLQAAMSGPKALKAIRGILWAGLLHEDKSLTVEDVGDLLDGADLSVVAAAIAEAIAAAFGTASGEPKNG
jgi:hypothetical protein